MKGDEVFSLVVVGALALMVGYHLGMRKAQRATAPNEQIAAVDPSMAWFLTWGGQR